MNAQNFPPAPMPSSPSRRTLLRGAAASSLASLLAACGGGGDAPADAFELRADRAGYFVGERAVLTVRFAAGTARLEPGVGPVQDGQRVTTPPLTHGQTYRLVVERAGQAPVVRELALDVRFRDRWLALEAPLASAFHAAVPTQDGGALVLGGSRNLSALSESIDRFDPLTRRFTRIGSLRTGRGSHTATPLGDGRHLVLGGNVGEDIGPVADLVDERTGEVVDGGALNRPRSRHTATRLADGRVLVVGGLDRNSAEIWDPATRRFRLLASRLAHDRQHHTATLLADGRVLVVGGYSEAPNYVFAELFDPASETFAPLPSAIGERRYLHHAHRLADGSVAIVGGEVLGELIVPLANCWRFDPAGGRFEAAQPLARAQTVARSVQRADDELLLLGGQREGEAYSAAATAWRRDGVRALAAMPAPRAWHSATVLGDGRILVVGGEDGRIEVPASTWIYE